MPNKITSSDSDLTHTPPQTPEPTQPNSPFWSIANKLIVIGLLSVIALHLHKINNTLNQTQIQQHPQNETLNTSTTPKPEHSNDTTLPVQPTKPTPENNASNDNSADNAHLADLAWTFNQSGLLTFNQINMDPKATIRLYELLDRLINNGFKGRALVNIYVGDFCLAMDKYGQGQLPVNNINMNECVLMSDIYGLDKIKDQYEHEIASALTGLNQKDILIIINTLSEPDGYPEHKPNFSAKSWNMVAQNHNRLELRLENTQKNTPK